MHLAPPLPQNLLAPWLQRAASSPSLLALAAEHFLLQGFKGALARAISLAIFASSSESAMLNAKLRIL